MLGGLLKTHKLGPTLPSNSQAGFVDKDKCDEDLVSGDTRAHEQPGLTAMHSLFLLEHNRLATEFKTQDSTLTDEELFLPGRLSLQRCNRLHIQSFFQLFSVKPL